MIGLAIVIIAALSRKVSAVPPSPLVASTGFYSIVGPEPDSSYYVVAVANATGGIPPYDFKFSWDDGKVDDEGITPTDTRIFTSPAYATPVTFTVTDSTGASVTAGFALQATHIKWFT